MKRNLLLVSNNKTAMAKRHGKISDCLGLWSKWMKPEEIAEIEANIAKARRISREARKEKLKRMRL
jgi:hypothetical protein